MSRHINNGRMPNSVPKQAKNVKFDPRDPRDPGVSLNLADGRRQVSELQESADFIRENPQAMGLVARKVFQAVDKNQDSEISWTELQDSFLGNLDELPFNNKEELKECFFKWAGMDSNKETLSYSEFRGFFEELISLI